MRARTAWLAGAAGAAIAVYRRMRRPAPVPAAEDPRADELRRKLDESRAVVDEREEFESGETPVDQAADPDAPVDDRRQAVHERGKAAAEQMRRKPGA